jgi:hypothetical protein
MDALDIKRCRHCVSPTATVQIEPHDHFAQLGPALLCFRCDRLPHPEDATFVPGDWYGRELGA